MIKLTASQINHMDEIHFDKQAVENVLKIATSHATNRLNELMKAEEKWWKELALVHDLDLYDNKYVVDRINGTIVVVDER